MTHPPGISICAPAAIGAQVTPSGVKYRVWAPDQHELQVRVERDRTSWRIPLRRDSDGYWSGFDAAGRAGDIYYYQFADGHLRPDVASRFQPQGVFGPSECIDPHTYRWECVSWRRPGWTGQSIYELHVGTFTATGTFRAAIERLDYLLELGVEAIELMPLADFAGQHNWGYDGVALYAPARCYGRPDDLRALVDAAHARGLAVIVDLVYNHVGPAGNWLPEYCADYFRVDESTPWGRTFNLDGARSQPVRDFLLSNARYWLDEFRFDGLRLDATHAIADQSPRHLVAELAAAAHVRGAFVIGEDDRNEAKLMDSPAHGGWDLDGVWADDFHHQVHVALTGEQHSYFAGYQGTTAELAATLTQGWTYAGQPFRPWANRIRGSSGQHLPTRAFVLCLENHDQAGNRARGERLAHLVTPREYRAAALMLCLSPYPPMLFMGQEWAASTPFYYFTDHGDDLGRRISAGRRREFGSPAQPGIPDDFPDPEAPTTFMASKLNWSELLEPGHAGTLALFRAGLAQRRHWLWGSALKRERWTVHQFGDWLAIRYDLGGADRMLLTSLRAVPLSNRPWPDPLALPRGRTWRIVLHSESTAFGGDAQPNFFAAETIVGPATVWLAAVEDGDRHANH